MHEPSRALVDPEVVSVVERGLLPSLVIESVHPDEPVVVRSLPAPWAVVGCGNYAAVLAHPQLPDVVVKVYAPGRSGIEAEVDVYRRLGAHPSYSTLHHAGPTPDGSVGYLVLRRLHGTTMFDCLRLGRPIPVRAVEDVDAALAYARQRGLHPHDVHPKNVMVDEAGRGLVVDVSDFGHDVPCPRWDDFKRAYARIYVPVLLRWNVPVPVPLLDLGRRLYRWWKRLRRQL